MQLVYMTHETQAELEIWVREAVENNLAACGHVFPAGQSVYRWQGKVVTEKEAVAILKTTDEAAEKLKSFLHKMSSYDCPCILSWPAEAMDDYAKWLKQEVKL